MDEADRLLVVQKLLDERDRLLLLRIETQAGIQAAIARDMEVAQKLADCRAAGRVFGQPVALTADPKDFVSLEALQDAMKRQRNGRDWVPFESRPVTPKQISDEERALRESSEVEPGNDQHDAEENTASPEARGRIRNLVQEYLRSVGSFGAQAADIRTWLRTQKQIETHSKTVGMTLYRLSLEELVERKGRTWFLVDPSKKGETRNPGVGAPGLDETLK